MCFWILLLPGFRAEFALICAGIYLHGIKPDSRKKSVAFRSFPWYSIPAMPRKKLPKPALPRICFIDHEIASGTYPNAPALARKYETSIASINRDIAYMRDMFHAPIKYDFLKKGYYYTGPVFRLPAAFVGAEGILALGMVKEHIELYEGTPIHEAALNLLESILAPLNGVESAEWFKERIVIPRIVAAPVNKEAWNALSAAMRENAVVTF